MFLFPLSPVQIVMDSGGISVKRTVIGPLLFSDDDDDDDDDDDLFIIVVGAFQSIIED